jgi:hypothetical protein
LLSIYMTAPRFCSMATATGPPTKRWRSVAAQSSTASGVFSSLLVSMRPPAMGWTQRRVLLSPVDRCKSGEDRVGRRGRKRRLRTSNRSDLAWFRRKSYSGRRRRVLRIRFRNQTLHAAVETLTAVRNGFDRDTRGGSDGRRSGELAEERAEIARCFTGFSFSPLTRTDRPAFGPESQQGVCAVRAL